MVSPEDAFVVLAELSLALAGFTGVVAAFGGRERAFNQVDRMRLSTILWSSGGVLAGSLLLFVLSAGGLSAAAAFPTVGISMALIGVVNYVQLNPRVLDNLRNETTTVSNRSFSLGVAWVVAVIGLYVTAAVLGGEAWPLLAGFSLQLIWGLLVFSRLLTSSN
jgi:hypothetical protein